MASSAGIQPSELGFFTSVATAGSLSAAARDLGITTAAVSKRLAQMEARIGMPLVTRTTRRMSLTPEGEARLREMVAVQIAQEGPISEALDTDERRQLIALLGRAYGALAKARGAS